MSDAQMPEKDPLIVGIARIIDHPSLYMGGPSHNSMRIAAQIVKHYRADLCASGQQEMDAMMAAGLLDTVRQLSTRLYGEPQTYPCDDVKRMASEITRLRTSGQQVRAGNPKMAQSALERLTELRGEVTDEPLEKSGRYFNENSFGDLTRCTHGDTGYFQNRADGEAIAILWGLWRNGALTPAPQPEATCRKCGGIMQPGIAMGQTVTAGAPDDLGGDVQTMSVGGPGAIMPCSKCADCGWSVTAPESVQAEAVPNCTGVKDKDGNVLFLGDRVIYRNAGPHTKREYWNPEYEIIWEAPSFTLKHVGGGKDAGSHGFILRSGGRNGKLELIKREVMRAAPAPGIAEAALADYRDNLCEGFCHDDNWTDGAHSSREMQNACGGCLAAAALLALKGRAP